MENLFKRLSACEIYNRSIDAYNMFRTKFKSVALQTFYSFNPRPSPYQKNLIASLRELRSSKDIIVTKPDKGKAAVILDRSDYISKMNNILSDTQNFKLVTVDLYKYILRLEDRNNRIVDSLIKSGSVSQMQGSDLKARGSRPGIMYGLPKVHKPDVPMRPIFSTTWSFNYSMSRYMVSLLSSLCVNEYTVKDSFQFASDIIRFSDSKCVMASFDVKSLFTNIPVAETCNIIIEKLFPTTNSLYSGFSKTEFSKILKNCVENNIFLFNGTLYEQVDGCPMGGCISPTIANIFLCFHEANWLNNCPLSSNP